VTFIIREYGYSPCPSRRLKRVGFLRPPHPEFPTGWGRPAANETNCCRPGQASPDSIRASASRDPSIRTGCSQMGPGSRVYSGASAAVETLGRDDSQFRIRRRALSSTRAISKDDVGTDGRPRGSRRRRRRAPPHHEGGPDTEPLTWSELASYLLPRNVVRL
jgi:hypothetical protein